MKVGELIEKLKEFDEDMVVAVYVKMGEDMDLIRNGPRIETSDRETQSYCKSDHPLDEKYGWFDSEGPTELLVIG